MPLHENPIHTPVSASLGDCGAPSKVALPFRGSPAGGVPGHAMSGSIRERRLARYSSASISLIGTSTKSGSPTYCSRSAKARFRAWFTVWMYSAELWPMDARSYPSRILRAWGNVGPWPHGPVLYTS